METLTLTPRTVEELATADAQLAEMFDAMPSSAVVQGARAAADWTLGRTDLAPMSGQPANPNSRGDYLDEFLRAGGAEISNAPGDPKFARGVAQWLTWWYGQGELPAWISGRRSRG